MSLFSKTNSDWSTLTAWELLPDEPDEQFERMFFHNPDDGSILLLVPGEKFLAGHDSFEVELRAYYPGITPSKNLRVCCVAGCSTTDFALPALSPAGIRPFPEGRSGQGESGSVPAENRRGVAGPRLTSRAALHKAASPAAGRRQE